MGGQSGQPMVSEAKAAQVREVASWESSHRSQELLPGEGAAACTVTLRWPTSAVIGWQAAGTSMIFNLGRNTRFQLFQP